MTGYSWLWQIALVPLGALAVTLVLFVGVWNLFVWYSRARLRRPETHT